MSHALTRERTAWIFLSDSDEPRHLYDIVFAVDVLRKRGVPDANVLVFTDHSKPGLHFSPYSISPRLLSDLASTLAGLEGYETAVFVVTGHGGMDGVGAARTVLTPNALLAAVRAIPGLAAGAIIVCQCFAGVFDLVDASTLPPLVIIGATRLNSSLSASTTLSIPITQTDGTPGLAAWAANIFMLTFFDWIAAPRDIDGDGDFTLADAYKYAGVLSNKRLIELKSSLYLEVRRLAGEVERLEATATLPATAVMSALRLAATRTRLQGHLETLHLHQEAWLLHATLARAISLSFS